MIALTRRLFLTSGVGLLLFSLAESFEVVGKLFQMLEGIASGRGDDWFEEWICGGIFPFFGEWIEPRRLR